MYDDIFSSSSEVTHIVTEFDNTEAVLRKLDIASEEDLCGAQVVKVKWFTDCMKAGHVVDVTDDHRIVSLEKTKVIYSSQNIFSIFRIFQTGF